MGNYVFSTDVLVDAVTEDAADETSSHDIGGDLIPALVDRGEAQVYDFTANEVPGVTEREHSYWRDVGTLDAFYDAHMDLDLGRPDLRPLQPRLADPELARAAAAGEVPLRGRGPHRARRSTRWSAPA